MGDLRKHVTNAAVSAALGLVSGLVTCATLGHLGSSVILLPFIGVVFALFLSLYSWRWEEFHFVWRTISFILATTAAFWVAVLAGFFGSRRGIEDPHLWRDDLFVGGIVGTALVGLARYLFLSRTQKPIDLTWRIGLISLLGGVLGAASDSVHIPVGTAIWNLLRLLHLVTPVPSAPEIVPQDTASLFSMFVVWQTCIAPTLTLLFPNSSISGQIPVQPSPSVPAKAPLPLPVWKKLFVVCAFVFLAYWLIRGIRLEHQAAQPPIDPAVASAQAYAEAPSLDNLPPLESLAPEKVLILHRIDGYSPDAPWLQQWAPAEPRPPRPADAVPARSYILFYQFPSPDRPAWNGAEVPISVTQFPNADWAKYRVTDHPLAGNWSSDPRAMHKVSKLGNTIYENSPAFFLSGSVAGKTCFAWPSANFKVEMCLTKPAEEPLLREYLLRYPSSLK
jgi:hypothetical protein